MANSEDNNGIPLTTLRKDPDGDGPCREHIGNGSEPQGKEEKNGRIINKDIEPINAHAGKGSSESTFLLNNGRLSKRAQNNYLWAALIISWISVFFSLGTGVAAIVLAIKGQSETLFAYGLDASLDSLSSVAVVWRFHGPETPESETKERRACIVIGILFIVSASSLIIKSVYSIISERHESKQIVLFETFGLVCATVSILLATAKIFVGLKLNSRALATDSIITYVGAAACIAGVAGLELYVQNSSLWYVDSLFGIACGLFLLAFGARLLCIIFRKPRHERLAEAATE